jgi:hypothetical protein
VFGLPAAITKAIGQPVLQSNELQIMSRTDTEQAQAIAIEALGFVASDEKLLPRFLALSGIEAQAIRQAAREPGFLAGVLDFILAHEPTLLSFAEASGHDPAMVAAARRSLPGGDGRFEVSI